MENRSVTDPRVSIPAAREIVPGRGELTYIEVAGRTVLSRALSKSPLRLLTPRNYGRGSWVFVANFGGGLVGGDDLRLSVEVGENATALLGTQASTKVYRSRIESRQRMDATVASGALFVSLPDPVVCYAGARYRQDIDISLADGASLVLLDGYTSGRSARGERWQFDAYTSRTRIHCNGRPILLDSVELVPAHGNLAERMGRFDALATLIVIGPRVRKIREALLAPAPPPDRRADRVTSASPLGETGALLRIAGAGIERVSAAVRAALDFLPGELGDDPFARKW